MEEIQPKAALWLEKELIPRVVEVLGKNPNEECHKISVPKNSLYLSRLYFVDMTFGKGKHDQVHLVVKIPPEQKIVRDLKRSNSLFCNEIFFYSALNKNYDELPACIYSYDESPENAVLVMQNITKLGYDLCPEKYDISPRFVLAAVKALGRFHARGYVLKERSPVRFFEATKTFTEVRYTHYEDNCFCRFINIIAMRPLKYLRKQNYDGIFCEKLEKVLSQAFDKILLDCIEPKEPLATLCHGDFTRNNVLFKDSDGKIQAKLIDFAEVKYSSPATDFSTFLYLSCSTEYIREDFPTIFSTYHDALYNCLKEAGILNLERYSLTALKEDYKRHAIFGYIIACFFRPVMSEDKPDDFETTDRIDVEQIAEMVANTGGEAMSKVLADMLIELRNNGYLEHIL